MPTTIKILSLISWFILQAIYLPAQVNAAEIKAYVEGKTNTLPTAISDGNIPLFVLIEQMEGYTDSPIPSVKSNAHRIIYKSSQERQGMVEQQQAVAYFLNCLAKDSTNYRQSLLNYLMQYPLSAYDPTNKKQLETVVGADSLLHYEGVLKLAGFVGVGEEKIQEVSRSENPSRKVAAKVALTRMGDETKLKSLMKNVVKIPINDDFVYQTAPLLLYVRQSQTMDYLFEAILSDEKNCTSPNPDSNSKMTCAYRLLEMVAPMIDDFPISVGTSGDLETDDYPAALATAREWIIANKSTYKINKNVF